MPRPLRSPMIESETWRAQKKGNEMNHPSVRKHTSLDFFSGGYNEAIWETLIALAMAAAISIGLISLSAHLNEVQTLREAGAGALQSTAEYRLPLVADIGRAKTASHYN